MKARLPIGLAYTAKRFPKAKELTAYTIEDIYTTRNNAGEIVKIEYLVSHQFIGQSLTELLCDTSIARKLSNEQLAALAV